MPLFISAAIAALSLSSFASANVAYRRQEQFSNSSIASSSSLSARIPVPLGTGSPSIIRSTAGAGPGSNSTATGVISSASSTGSSASSTPSASAPASISIVDGIAFSLEFNVTYAGIALDIAVQLTKRADETIGQCLSTCAANTHCVGTAFNSTAADCTFYSSIVPGSRTAAPGITFATVQGRASNSTSTLPSSTRTNNGTSVTATPNNPGAGINGTFPNYESLICPLYNDEVLLNTDGSQYLIRCGTNAVGSIIAVRKARMIRRQSTFGNEWIVDCIDTCTALGNCAATTYNSAQGTCTFYSDVGSTFADAASDLAILAADDTGAAVPVPLTRTITTTNAGVTQTITTVPLTTSTVYSTTTRTIQSCAPGVACTAATVTEVVVAYTTVCPVSAVPTGVAIATGTVKVCTACQYVPSTVTVYQCPTAPGAPGAGKPVPVTTKVISVPVLPGPTAPAGSFTTATFYQTKESVTTTCGVNGCAKATVTAVVSLYTTICPVSSTGAVPSAGQPSPGVPAPSAPGAPAPAPSAPGASAPGAPAPAPSAPGASAPAPPASAPAPSAPAPSAPGASAPAPSAPGAPAPAPSAPGASAPAPAPAPSAPGAPAPAPSAPASSTVIIPGTTKPAETVSIPGTTNQQTTVPASSVVIPGTTLKASSTIVQYTPTTSGVVAFTGAAVKNAGMGFAAVAAGVAALVL